MSSRCKAWIVLVSQQPAPDLKYSMSTCVLFRENMCQFVRAWVCVCSCVYDAHTPPWNYCYTEESKSRAAAQLARFVKITDIDQVCQVKSNTCSLRSVHRMDGTRKGGNTCGCRFSVRLVKLVYTSSTYSCRFVPMAGFIIASLGTIWRQELTK